MPNQHKPTVPEMSNSELTTLRIIARWKGHVTVSRANVRSCGRVTDTNVDRLDTAGYIRRAADDSRWIITRAGRTILATLEQAYLSRRVSFDRSGGR